MAKEVKKTGRLGSRSVLTRIPHEILAEAYNSGIDINEKNNSGSLFHVDQTTIYSKVNECYKGRIEIMDTKTALKEYPWLDDYRWKLINKEDDEFTQRVGENYSGGYYIRILPNVEVTFPLQSCLMITKPNLEQRVHNIIIAEEGSKANIITSCVQHLTNKASHLGISEIYVKNDASLNFTMIHNWSEDVKVRPRSAVMLCNKATFVSNYICLRPVKDVQMYPTAFCNGEDSRSVFNSILYGNENSSLDIGSKAILNGKNSLAEMVTRAIARQNARIIVRGMIEGNNPECKGHLECRGLIIDDDSFIQSIPELVARRKGAEITHEAAVGKISEKEIQYLMTRKLTRDQAVSLIIRGFMDTGIIGLPAFLNDEINKIVEYVAEAK